jgi:SAM-dependent methyltransferase
MRGIVDRYDAGAVEYARYWAPVLVQTATRLMDEVDEHYRRAGDDDTRFRAEAGADHAAAAEGQLRSESMHLRLLDVGAGIGTLAMSALERWPHAEVVASDAAAGMLEYARQIAADRGIDPDGRLSFAVGQAEELPLDNASVDVAVSSFVLQLVPDRIAALAEIRRVLRPGGLFAYVTWLDRDSGEPFRAADEFDEAVYDLEVDEPDESDEDIAGDVTSAEVAEDELRQAGFVRVSAREETLVYEWTMESYLDYKLNYDERSLLSTLDREQQRALELNARQRLSRLKPADFRWHAPVVFARAFNQP